MMTPDERHLAYARQECARSAFHDHEGCTCDDATLLRRIAPQPIMVAPLGARLFEAWTWLSRYRKATA